MEFKGFTAPNQHTQVPNEFFEIMYAKDTKFGEVKLLGFMIRNTFGWHRAGNSLQFSFTELMRATNMSKDTTNNSIKSCLAKGYIQRKEIDGQMYYRLNVAEYADYPWDLSFDWKKVNPQLKQSENQTGPKIRPTAVRKSDQDQSENQTGKNAQSIEAKEETPSLKKGLNKGLKKIEEEEEHTTVITESYMFSLMQSKLNEFEITNEKTIKAAFIAASKCKQIGGTDYEAAENYAIAVVEEKMSKIGQKQKEKQPRKSSTRQPVRKEEKSEAVIQQEQGQQKPATYADMSLAELESMKSTFLEIIDVNPSASEQLAKIEAEIASRLQVIG